MQRLVSSLAEVLASLGVPADAIERECAEMSSVQLARTDDRRTVGNLVELQRSLRYHLEDGTTMSLTELSLHLAETPLVAAKIFPDRDTCRLFGVLSPRRRARGFLN